MLTDPFAVSIGMLTYTLMRMPGHIVAETFVERGYVPEEEVAKHMKADLVILSDGGARGSVRLHVGRRHDRSRPRGGAIGAARLRTAADVVAAPLRPAGRVYFGRAFRAMRDMR